MIVNAILMMVKRCRKHGRKYVRLSVMMPLDPCTLRPTPHTTPYILHHMFCILTFMHHVSYILTFINDAGSTGGSTCASRS